jgi:hypothetical protein
MSQACVAGPTELKMQQLRFLWRRRVRGLQTDVLEERVASNLRVEDTCLCYSLTLSGLRYFCYPEDVGDKFLRNVGLY